MKEKLEILVVEDQPEHLADVRAVLDSRKQYGIGADYVSNLDDTKRKLEKRNYDGILSDVFFPEREGEAESAAGLWVAEYGRIYRIPFILVTSTYHHGDKTEPINHWLRRKGPKLVDWMPSDDEYYQRKNSEGDRKNWEGGLLSLMYFIEGLKKGLIGCDPDNFGEIVNVEKDCLYMNDMVSIVNEAHHNRTIPNFGKLSSESARLAKEVFDKYCKDLFS